MILRIFLRILKLFPADAVQLQHTASADKYPRFQEPAQQRLRQTVLRQAQGQHGIGREAEQRQRRRVGEYLRYGIGVRPRRGQSLREKISGSAAIRCRPGDLRPVDDITVTVEPALIYSAQFVAETGDIIR